MEACIVVISPLFRRKFTRQGAPPGEFHADLDAGQPVVSAIAFNTESVEERTHCTLSEALSLPREGRVLWIDVQGLGDRNLIEALGQEFRIHPLALADVVNVGQRPKVEDYDGFLYFVLRMVRIDEDHAIHREQVSIILTDNAVISFQETHGDCLDPLRDRLRRAGTLVRRQGSAFLAAMIIDAIVDGYFPVLETYGERIEELEDRVVADAQQSVLAEIYDTKRHLMTMRRAVWPLRDALNQLLRDPHDEIIPEVLPYLRDAADHVMQCVDVIENYREIASGLVDIYLSSVSNRTNEVMRVLTILASIFIPITFLAGVYGMNFDYLPETKWRYGYALFWLICILTAGAFLVVFHRLGWIGPRSGRR